MGPNSSIYNYLKFLYLKGFTLLNPGRNITSLGLFLGFRPEKGSLKMVKQIHRISTYSGSISGADFPR